MRREVGHSSLPKDVQNTRDKMEFLEPPGGGTLQSFQATRRGGRGQVDEVEDDLISLQDPGHRASRGSLD